MNDQYSSRRVQILRDSVAQKIAAGEVIDRPFSVVRELLDNSIDAGAAAIDVSIEQGGLKRIRVTDDGDGMSREDLELSVRPHATSKIESAEDIYALRTLGFRGEALSSIASCARLSITSALETGEAHTLEVREGEQTRLSPSRGKKGTVVEVTDIFYSMPGRRKFLKSAGAETSACKKTFLEKALPYPQIAFRFSRNGEIDLNLSPSSLSERIASAYPGILSHNFLYEIEESAGDFSFKAVLASPSIVRKDRRYIHIYVNGRRIQEFSLIQAVEYAYRSILPGGSFPAAFLFLSIDPSLVDFNIHPAKREAKIKNLSAVHHEIVERTGEFLRRNGFVQNIDRAGFDRNYTQTSAAHDSPAGGSTAYNSDRTNTFFGRPLHEAPRSTTGTGFAGKTGPSPDISRLKKVGEIGYEEREKNRPLSEAYTDTPAYEEKSFVYHGQVFGVFLMVETEHSFYLIDQHASHERIIYNSLLETPSGRQTLLIADPFEPEAEEEKLLLSRLDELAELNISVEQVKPGLWNLIAVPENCIGMEEEIIAFLLTPVESVSSLQSALYADIACKRAIKEGEVLEETSARELIKKSFALPEPRCPHGRPIWIKLSEEELYRRIGRT